MDKFVLFPCLHPEKMCQGYRRSSSQSVCGNCRKKMGNSTILQGPLEGFAEDSIRQTQGERKIVGRRKIVVQERVRDCYGARESSSDLWIWRKGQFLQEKSWRKPFTLHVYNELKGKILWSFLLHLEYSLCDIYSVKICLMNVKASSLFFSILSCWHYFERPR